ncbi:hypothetical protein EHQ53_14070 [Leptospira langatensis]|uniref:Uncharacterized protein n=1 Tax=Leptospira langatensis TaxID=2484983 RepID=A0ABY2M988_9LEPT|nr:hypothetical protein [Leptospira langatensis]TGL39644.1 hypothetical protein EHQ53_14070 [Leptospira langatensis]
MDKLLQPKLKQSEAISLQENMATELTAAFKLMAAEVEALLDEAGKEGWTIEELQTALEGIE